MATRLQAAARIVRRILSWLAALLWLLIVIVALSVYLGTRREDAPLQRAVAGYANGLLAGQRTERLALSVDLSPAAARLASRATLSVRSLDDQRQRFYFLLNPGLRLHHVAVAGTSPPPPLTVYRFGPVIVVELQQKIPRDHTIDLTFEYDGAPCHGGNVLGASEVYLPRSGRWYPTDMQSFFSTDVAVTLPADLTVAYNGADGTRFRRGALQEVRWSSERPILGLSLVAGRYEQSVTTADGITYRLFLPADLAPDAKPLLDKLQQINRVLTEHYGPSGFKSVGAVVDRHFRHGFNDGSGLIGLSMRQLRDGNYGAAALGHELAHDWWGDTVAGEWLSPGSGAVWITEGFAEFSSLLATEALQGPDALARRLTGEFFDPEVPVILARQFSSWGTPPRLRAATARKGAYVTMMLRHTVGDDAFFRGLRQVLEHFRYGAASEPAVQQILEDAGKKKLDAFFTDWVRSDRLADLSLEPAEQGAVTVTNQGRAAISADIQLWLVRKGQTEPVRTAVHVGDRIPLPADTDEAVLDPLLTWLDLERANNRYPRRSDPVWVSIAGSGEEAVASGEPFAWTRVTLTDRDRDGHTLHTWEFNRGLLGKPRWAPDGSTLVVSSDDDPRQAPEIVSFAASGLRRSLGRGWSPAPAAKGIVYAAMADRIVRLAPGDPAVTVVRRPGERLDQPLPAPDGTRLVYTAGRGGGTEVRLVDADGRNDRALLAWDRDCIRYRWSTDGQRLYTVIGGAADWQVWDIPLASGGVRVLASGAARIPDMALAPNGTALAFTAVADLADPTRPAGLYILDLATRNVRTIEVPQTDLGSLAWQGNDAILVVGVKPPFIFPARRSVLRVRLSDGAVEELP